MSTYRVVSAIVIIAVTVVFTYLTNKTGDSIYSILFFGLLFIYFAVTHFLNKKNKANRE